MIGSGGAETRWLVVGGPFVLPRGRTQECISAFEAKVSVGRLPDQRAAFGTSSLAWRPRRQALVPQAASNHFTPLRERQKKKSRLHKLPNVPFGRTRCVRNCGQVCQGWLRVSPASAGFHSAWCVCEGVAGFVPPSCVFDTHFVLISECLWDLLRDIGFSAAATSSCRCCKSESVSVLGFQGENIVLWFCET